MVDLNFPFFHYVNFWNLFDDIERFWFFHIASHFSYIKDNLHITIATINMLTAHCIASRLPYMPRAASKITIAETYNYVFTEDANSNSTARK